MRLDLSLEGTAAQKRRKKKKAAPAKDLTFTESMDALATFDDVLLTGRLNDTQITAEVQQPWARAELIEGEVHQMLHIVPLRDMPAGTLLYVNGQVPNFNAATLVNELQEQMRQFQNAVNIVLLMRNNDMLLANTLQAAINRWATTNAETLQILGINADDLYPKFPTVQETKLRECDTEVFDEDLQAKIEHAKDASGVMPRIHGTEFLMTPEETVAYDVPVIFAADVIEFGDLMNIKKAFKGQTVFLFESGMFFDADPEGPDFWDVILDSRSECNIVPIFLPSDVEAWAQLFGGKMMTRSDIATPGFEKDAIVLRRGRVTKDTFEFTT